MNTKRLILFDIDGTLLHASGAGRISTREAMLEVFGTASTVESHQFGGKTDYFTLVELLRDHGYDETAVGAQMAAYEQAIAQHLARIMENHLAYALPGALETVERLRQDSRFVVGLVTGNCSTTAPIKLRAAGFDPLWFVVGAYGSEAIERDDLPALALQRAISHSQCEIAPQDVIVVGDTVADILCARAIGAQAVAVCTGYTAREVLITAKPDFLLDDLKTFLEILQV